MTDEEFIKLLRKEELEQLLFIAGFQKQLDKISKSVFTGLNLYQQFCVHEPVCKAFGRYPGRQEWEPDEPCWCKNVRRKINNYKAKQRTNSL